MTGSIAANGSSRGTAMKRAAEWIGHCHYAQSRAASPRSRGASTRPEVLGSLLGRVGY
jgi:hypothetical protein